MIQFKYGDNIFRLFLQQSFQVLHSDVTEILHSDLTFHIQDSKNFIKTLLILDDLYLSHLTLGNIGTEFIAHMSKTI